MANAGHISSIAKYYNSDYDKKRIIKALYDNESIDKIIATDFVNTLSNIVDIIIKQEIKENENQKKLAENKARLEVDRQKRLLEDFLYKSLVNIIEHKGIEILNDYNYCKAYLKDMAKGDYIDKITSISEMLKNKYQDINLKKRIFKVQKEKLLEKIYNDHSKDHNLTASDKVTLSILIDVITSIEKKQSDKDGNNWINNLFKFSRK